MEGIGALGNWTWQHLAGWIGKGSGSAWIMAGTLAFAGGSAALLSPTPVHSRVVQARTTVAMPTPAMQATYTTHHHCDGAEDGGY
ncbi:MAG: hypothetical protein ACRDGS_01810 [Chloroflexota bacterium]